MANALAFIESDLEDKSKEERSAQTLEKAKALVSNLTESNRKFECFDASFWERSADTIEIVYSLLENADKKALDLFSCDPSQIILTVDE